MSTLKTHKSTREFNGSIPVGSKVGKVLLNSVDASKIMDAVRKVASGNNTTKVTISKTTAASLSNVSK